MGGGHEHLCHLRVEHQLHRLSRQGLCRQLECLCLLALHSDSELFRRPLFRAVLPSWRQRVGLHLPRGEIRTMGPPVCLGLLPAHADSPYGQHPLPAGRSHAHPDGVEHAHGDYRHLDRHHHLLDAGRPESRDLGRRHPGHHPHRRCAALSGHPLFLDARRSCPGVRPGHPLAPGQQILIGRVHRRPHHFHLLGMSHLRHLHQPAELRYRPELRAALPCR